MKISIIIPLYNAGELIIQTINSILEQDYLNYEILIINDGSTDNSVDLINSLNSDKIQLFTIKNSGANFARNYGLKNSSGDLIYFMDQDDFIIEKHFFSSICEYFKLNEKLDFIIFKYTEYFQNDNKFIARPNYNQSIINSSAINTLLYHLVKSGNIPISPWDKILRKSFLKLNNINFPVGLIAGDINWFIDLFLSAENIKIINETFYAYRRQVSTSLTNSFSNAKFENFLHIIENEATRVKELNNCSSKDLLLSFIAYEYCILLGLYPNLDDKVYCNYKKRIDNLNWLLQYDLNKKVKYVNTLRLIFGNKLASIILSLYIKKIVNRN